MTSKDTVLSTEVLGVGDNCHRGQLDKLRCIPTWAPCTGENKAGRCADTEMDSPQDESEKEVLPVWEEGGGSAYVCRKKVHRINWETKEGVLGAGTAASRAPGEEPGFSANSAVCLSLMY